MGVTGWWIELISNAASTLRSPRAAAVGSRNNPTGTAQPKLKPTVASLNGLMVPTGAATSTLQQVSFEAIAGLDGAVDATLRSPTAAAASAQVFTGAAGMSLRTATTALAGTQTQSGSIGASIAKATTAASGTQAATGIQFISGASAAATSVTLGTHAAGDLLIAYAFRDGSTTALTRPAGWTNISTSAGANNCTDIQAYKVATSSAETSGTWTNATGLTILVYRNAGTGIGNFTGQAGTGSTLTYLGLTRTFTDGQSWIVRFAGHRTATNLLTNTPTGYTARAGVASESRGIDSGGPVASDPSTQTQTVNASSGWFTCTLEINPSA
jgi:hypothetical protein